MCGNGGTGVCWRKIENGDEPFLLGKKSWMFGWSGQLLDGQETSMREEWAKSHS